MALFTRPRHQATRAGVETAAKSSIISYSTVTLCTCAAATDSAESSNLSTSRPAQHELVHVSGTACANHSFCMWLDREYRSMFGIKTWGVLSRLSLALGCNPIWV